MRLHILGICGTFMGGVALLARELGHEVSGSDANVYPPMSTLLQSKGIDIVEGYDPAQLSPAPDVVVIGNALSRGNPAVEHVLNRSGSPITCCLNAGCLPWPALTAKRPPPACWRVSWTPPGWRQVS